MRQSLTSERAEGHVICEGGLFHQLVDGSSWGNGGWGLRVGKFHIPAHRRRTGTGGGAGQGMGEVRQVYQCEPRSTFKAESLKSQGV